MALLTGKKLLDSIIGSTNADVNTLIQSILSVKLQQMMDNGTYSKLGAAIAMSGFSSSIRDSKNIIDLSNTIGINTISIEDDTIITKNDSTTINFSSEKSIYKAEDGIPETFIYEIDSSDFVIQSLESGNIYLQNFNTTEDTLILKDTLSGTTSTSSFLDDIIISSSTNIEINFDAIIINNNDIIISESGFSLSLIGVSDFSSVDFSVIQS